MPASPMSAEEVSVNDIGMTLLLWSIHFHNLYIMESQNHNFYFMPLKAIIYRSLNSSILSSKPLPLEAEPKLWPSSMLPINTICIHDFFSLISYQQIEGRNCFLITSAQPSELAQQSKSRQNTRLCHTGKTEHLHFSIQMGTRVTYLTRIKDVAIAIYCPTSFLSEGAFINYGWILQS